MKTLTELQNAKGLYGLCPNCRRSFALRRGQLYDATRPFPDFAAQRLAAAMAELKRKQNELAAREARLSQRSFTSAATSGVGQRLEMLVASLPGLPVNAADCRSLLKPIDYIAFPGVSGGLVEAIRLIEVKTGDNRLSKVQRTIKETVENGAVSLRIVNHELQIE